MFNKNTKSVLVFINKRHKISALEFSVCVARCGHIALAAGR